MRAPTPTTVRQAGQAWLKGAERGEITTRSGDPYKPSALRGYREALERRIYPQFGGNKLCDLTRVDLQEYVDGLKAQGLSPSSVRNLVMPLRAIYRRALSRGEVVVNPTSGVELAAVRGKRDRIAPPDEAARLLEALPREDRPIWATALYGGLRLGELRALRWESVDLAAGTISVQRSWDAYEGEIEPKSAAGKRRVPIAAVLRDHLVDRRMSCTWQKGFVFGTETRPFGPKSLRARATAAWRAADLKPITLQECRHTFASLMIAAGVNAKALTSYMGHSSITITYDRYGHLMPGNEDEAAALLDAYLERCESQARTAAVAED